MQDERYQSAVGEWQRGQVDAVLNDLLGPVGSAFGSGSLFGEADPSTPLSAEFRQRHPDFAPKINDAIHRDGFLSVRHNLSRLSKTDCKWSQASVGTQDWVCTHSKPVSGTSPAQSAAPKRAQRSGKAADATVLLAAVVPPLASHAAWHEPDNNVVGPSHIVRLHNPLQSLHNPLRGVMS